VDPAIGLCLGGYGGPRGGAVSYERRTPVSTQEATWNTALPLSLALPHACHSCADSEHLPSIFLRSTLHPPCVTELNLLWMPHNLASLGALLRAQIPTASTPPAKEEVVARCARTGRGCHAVGTLRPDRNCCCRKATRNGGHAPYRGTSLMSNRHPVGPYCCRRATGIPRS